MHLNHLVGEINDPNITDWLMVIITAVYVIATIAIWIANNKTAKASKLQLEEMKRQFAEDNRPKIEMEFCFEKRTWFYIKFVNNGRLTAQHVKIELSQDFIDSIDEDSFKSVLNKINGKECIIGVGQHYNLYIGSNKLKDNHNIKPVNGFITYESNGKVYKDTIFLDLEQYMTFFSSNTEEETMIKSIKGIERSLASINNRLNSMNR